MQIFQVKKLIPVIKVLLGVSKMLKGIANQENSRTLTGVKAVLSKLSQVSLIAVITPGHIEPGEKELC